MRRALLSFPLALLVPLEGIAAGSTSESCPSPELLLHEAKEMLTARQYNDSVQLYERAWLCHNSSLGKGVLIEQRLSFIRALRLLGAYERAATAIRDFPNGTDIYGVNASASMAYAERLDSSIALEGGLVAACMGHLDTAISAHERSMQLALGLLEGNSGLVTTQQFNARVLELVKLFKWTNQTESAEMFLSTLELNQKPGQWVGQHYDQSLRKSAKPWHNAKQFGKGMQAVKVALREAWPSLKQEYVRLLHPLLLRQQRAREEGAGIQDEYPLLRQNECLHEAGGWW
jgi:hypothetical protein